PAGAARRRRRSRCSTRATGRKVRRAASRCSWRGGRRGSWPGCTWSGASTASGTVSRSPAPPSRRWAPPPARRSRTPGSTSAGALKEQVGSGRVTVAVGEKTLLPPDLVPWQDEGIFLKVLQYVELAPGEAPTAARTDAVTLASGLARGLEHYLKSIQELPERE